MPAPLTPSPDVSRKRSFDAVVDARTRVLVLGSLPGELSLARAQYYGNPQNRFWRLMSQVLGVELVPLAYEQRLAALLEHGVGLWDVVAEAQREGSLDARIRNHTGNDLVALASSLPRLTTIAFNGGTAARLGQRALGADAERYRVIALPSSSPAYTLAYEAKLSAWLALRAALQG